MRVLFFSIILTALLSTGCQKTAAQQNAADLPALATPVLVSVLPIWTPSTEATPESSFETARAPHPVLSPTPIPTPTPTPTPDEPGFVEIAEGFYYHELNDTLRHRITGLSYPADDKNAKIKYGDLRYIRLLYHDFDSAVHEGELIVNAKVAGEVTEIFYELYQAAYPFTSIVLVDEYGESANDDLSMVANNTSAFNYRTVAGSKTLSRHSYGAAIDINPLLNPYVRGKNVSPPEGTEYADRKREFTGKIDRNDLCYQLFKKRGWSWGGDWSGDKDYQHFSKDLGY